MGSINKHVDLESRYAIFGEDGYFVEPFIIKSSIVEDLNLGMSYNQLKTYLTEAKVTLTNHEIKHYLEEQRKKEEPNLEEKQAKLIMALPSDISIWTDEDIEYAKRKLVLQAIVNKYEYNPNILEYYKKYIANLKRKLNQLFNLLSTIDDISSNKIDLNSIVVDFKVVSLIKRLELHINQLGNIYFPDAVNLVEAIVYNFKDLYIKVNEANNLETYVDFKLSHEVLYYNGEFNPTYPSPKLKITDLNPNKEDNIEDTKSKNKTKIIKFQIK